MITLRNNNFRTSTEKVHVPSVFSLLFCCYSFPFIKTLKLVMKGIKLELWIASLNNMELYHSTEKPWKVNL